MTKNELHFLDAAKVGDVEAVKAMLAAGVRVDTPDDRKTPKNRTALMHAAEGGHLKIIDLLLSAEAKLEAKDKGVGFDWPGSNTALILAIKNKHIHVANRLLDAGANPKAKSVDTTVLRAAVETGNFDLIKRLVELGADPGLTPSDKISAMLVAIDEKNGQAVELFLKNGADPNAKAPGAGFLLSSAIHERDLEICQLLCRYGASPNVQEEDHHFTPLMTACIWSQNEDLFRFLLSIGAKVNEVNIRNETAMDLIEQSYQRHLKASPIDIQCMAKKGEDVKVTIKSLEKIKSMLRGAGAKFYKELNVDNVSEEPPPKKLSSEASHLGVSHFLQFIYDGQPEWSLIAVKAPIDNVSPAFAKLHRAKKRMLNVPLELAGPNGDELAPLVAVIQVKDSPWTIIFCSLLWLDSEHLKTVPKDAKKLSFSLKTRSITFIGEDTSDSMAYEIFESGKSLERANWEGGGPFSIFKSTLRDEPELEEVDDTFIGEFFKSQEIYIPACYPKLNNRKAWVAVDKVSAGTILRADLIEL